MEDWLNVDLLTSYEFPLGPLGLEVEARVTNLFDDQAELGVDDRLIIGRATAPNNPAFGQGTSFAPPRAFVLSAIVRY
jgi:outer membrane receptor protein involved in Fe transport